MMARKYSPPDAPEKVDQRFSLLMTRRSRDALEKAARKADIEKSEFIRRAMAKALGMEEDT